MNTIIQDIRFAIRGLIKRRGFSTLVIVTLALGIGANTAVFSVVNAVMLQALPFEEGDRLVRLYDARRREDGQISQVSLSPRNFYEVRAQAGTFDSLTAQMLVNLNFVVGEGSERVIGIGVSDGWLKTLGVRPSQGRGFTQEEEAAGSDGRVALISHGFWERRFGAATDTVGKNIVLNNQSYTIIGVLPRGFDYPYHSEVWLPTSFDRNNGRIHPLNVQARLKPGVTLVQAQAELDAISQRLALAYPDTNTGYQVKAVPLREVLVEGGDKVVMVLLATVGFLLLIACANVANLLLAQTIGRRKEFAIRTALGASRARQVRQFLIENLLLSIAGGVLGCLATLWLRDSLLMLVPSDLTYVLPQIPVNFAVMGFALLISILVGSVLAIVPALRASRLDLNATLREGTRSVGDGSGERLLNVLVVGEVAVALVLLAGAGLMIQNLYRLQRADLGIVTDHLLTMKVAFSELGYDQPAQRQNLARQLVERLEAQPGILNVAAANLVPLTGGNVTASILPEGKPVNPNEQLVVSYRVVSPEYFQTIKAPLLKGREFSPQDTTSSALVAVISQSTARRYWAGDDPLGKRVRTLRGGAQSEWITVVGVANDVREPTPSRRDTPETLYIPLAQDNSTDRTWATLSMQFAVRSATEPLSALPGLKNAIWQVDRRLTVFDVATADQLYGTSLSQTRVGTVMVLAFAGFGLLLAALGTYGVFSYRVSRRTREIGIRMALGAQSGEVLWLVMKRGALLALIGIAIGLAGALALTRFMSGVLSEIQPGDPITLVIVTAVLGLIALLACLLPALRATRVDPLVALRYE